MSILITLLIYACVLAILWWAVTNLGLPEPFRKVAIVVVAIVAIVMLLSLTGTLGGLNGLRLR